MTLALLFIALLSLILLPGTVYLCWITIFGLLALFNLPKRQQKEIRKLSKPLIGTKMAVVIPAHNEANSIADTIKSLQACTPNLGGADIIVIADNCTDKTSAIAHEFGVEVLERHDELSLGKGSALNFAFEELIIRDYDFFVVLDADTNCDPNFLRAIEASCNTETKALQVCNLINGEDKNPYSKITSVGFYAMNYLRPLARDYFNLSVGLFGNGFALSKDLLLTLPYKAKSITEDYEYHLQLISSGFVSNIVLSTSVHSRMPSYDDGASAQRARWEGGKLRMARKFLPAMLIKIATGNTKLIEPALDLTLPPLSFYAMGMTLIAILSFFSSNISGLIMPAIGFLLLLTHTLTATYCIDHKWHSLTYLLSLPKYVAWKVLQFTKIIGHSKEKTTWTRTNRK